MTISSDKKAASLTELLITSALVIALLTTALAGFVFLKQIFATNIAKVTFQRGAAVIMDKIMRGKGDPNPGGIRLSEANTVIFDSDNVGKLTFIGADNIKRMYSLSGDSAKLLYSDENGLQNIMYTAPQGAIIGLKFSPMNIGPTLCVNIYVSVSQVVSGRTVRGALESSAYLRNHYLWDH